MAKQVTDELVNQVLNGNYGNGATRKEQLTALGYDAAEVQAAVNKKLYGSGSSTSSSSKSSASIADIGISMPTYSSSYKTQIDSLTDRLLNREAFSYNPDEDKTYQQYAKDYRRYGEMAMEDVLGKVAARTGGMASSYATSASQQAYNGYMAELASKIPELEQLAYSMYLEEGDQMRDKINFLSQLEANEYARHQDSVNAYLSALAALDNGDDDDKKKKSDETVLTVDEDTSTKKYGTPVYGSAAADRLAYYGDPLGLLDEKNLDAGYNSGLIDEETYINRLTGLYKVQEEKARKEAKAQEDSNKKYKKADKV